MTQTITAIFEDGVLKPAQPLDLRDHAQRCTFHELSRWKSNYPRKRGSPLWIISCGWPKRTPARTLLAINFMNAVDTNILLYSIDKTEPVKRPKATAFLLQLIADGSTVLLWQVLAESVQQLRPVEALLGSLADAEFDQHVKDFRALFPMVFPKIGVLDHALDLAKRYSLSHWDSMILGACKETSVMKLYTEDMGAPTVIDGIQLVNPLI